jgi:serum/glucocorticoid-regulated kinase 2
VEIIGKGAYGPVWKVQLKRKIPKSNLPINSIFAMKEMSKVKIYHKKAVDSVLNERLFLEKLHFPFLINMNYAFQTTDHLYVIMDLHRGGTLGYHTEIDSKYTERQIKFIVTNIILSLQYIHSHHIVHRDVTPSNLVFDLDGFLHLTDFGYAQECKPGEEIVDSNGTIEYMAPEVLFEKPHTHVVDYYSLGVVTYELLTGFLPYSGRTRKAIKEEMASRPITLNKNDLPNGWKDYSVIEFTLGLLKHKQQERLGYKSIKEIMNHQWLEKIDWNSIRNMGCVTPITYSQFEKYYIVDDLYKKEEEKNQFDEQYVKKCLDSITEGRYFADYYFDVKNKATYDNQGKFFSKRTLETTYNYKSMTNSERMLKGPKKIKYKVELGKNNYEFETSGKVLPHKNENKKDNEKVISTSAKDPNSIKLNEQIIYTLK